MGRVSHETLKRSLRKLMAIDDPLGLSSSWGHSNASTARPPEYVCTIELNSGIWQEMDGRSHWGTGC